MTIFKKGLISAFLTILVLVIQACSTVPEPLAALPPLEQGLQGSGGVFPSASVSPASASVQLKPGETQRLTFKLTTAEIPPQKVDILFLFDVTSSMQEVLDEAKANGVKIMGALAQSFPDIAFGVGSFADFDATFEVAGVMQMYGSGDDYPWRLNQDINPDKEKAAQVINSLAILDGGDLPESTLTALWNSVGIGWRPQARRILVLFSDAPAHDPDFYIAAGGKDYGLDPGPDGLAGTADDLRMQSTLRYLADQSIAVFTVYASAAPKDTIQYGFQALADQTGGRVFNLKNAADLSRTLENDLGASLQSIGVLSAQTFAQEEADLAASISPEKYTQVPGGETREFTLILNAGQKITRAGETLVRVEFSADNHPIAYADNLVDLVKPKSSLQWGWLLGAALGIAALWIFRRRLLALLPAEKTAVLVHQQDDRETRITVHDGFTIGAGPGCDLRLAEAGLEELHAQLRLSDGKWLIASQIGQENIRLNGRWVGLAGLQPGDEIRLGNALLEFTMVRTSRAGQRNPVAGLLEWFKGPGRWRWALLGGALLLGLILFWPKNPKTLPPTPVAPVPVTPATPVNTPLPSVSATPAGSAVSDQIAFVNWDGKQDSIFLMNSDGSNRRKILGEDGVNYSNPTWSPDGSTLAYLRSTPGLDDLYLMTGFKGGKVEIIPVTKGTKVINPLWAPDGRKIAFVSNNDLYLYLLDEGVTRLLGSKGYWYAQYSWARGSDRLAVIYQDPAGGYLNLLIMDTNGNLLEKRNESFNHEYLAWAPGGDDVIIYGNDRVVKDGGFERFLVKDGTVAFLGGSAELCEGQFHPINPLWSPDGKYLAYECGRNLYILDYYGTQAPRLVYRYETSYEGIDALNYVSWSPDSQWLLFRLYDGTNTSINKVRADGSQFTRLSPEAVLDTSPDWQP
jgi:Tol biopolymer transport system component